MVFGMVLMFALETSSLVILFWFAWKRIATHLKDNPEGVAALTTHLFLPLLGKKE